MVQSAAQRVDQFIPHVPVRQWVLSFPIGLRILFAVHPELLTPVLRIDIEHCPHCGGHLRKIVATIEDPAVIVRILTHLSLPARASPRSPARRVDLFQAA